MTRELATANYERAPAWILEYTIWANHAPSAKEAAHWRRRAAEIKASMVGWASI